MVIDLNELVELVVNTSALTGLLLTTVAAFYFRLYLVGFLKWASLSAGLGWLFFAGTYFAAQWGQEWFLPHLRLFFRIGVTMAAVPNVYFMIALTNWLLPVIKVRGKVEKNGTRNRISAH